MTSQPEDLTQHIPHKDPFLAEDGAEEWADIFKGEEHKFSEPFYREQAEAARRREERPMRCAHGHCRTSLTDETAVFCPHSLPFCGNCTWEEACDECNQAVSA